MSTPTSQPHVSIWHSLTRKLRSTAIPAWSAISTALANFGVGIKHRGRKGIVDIPATVDVDRLATKLSVCERARADGKGDLPPSTQEVVAGTQKEIVFYFKQLQKKAQGAAADLADRLRALRASVDVTETTSRLNDIPSKCENEILRRTAEFESQLEFLRQRQQHYEDLLDDHHLGDQTSRSHSAGLRYGLIAALFGAGAIAIMDTAKQGTVDPSLVSVSWAVLISLTVVLVPLVLGAAVAQSAKQKNLLRVLAVWIWAVAAIGFVASSALIAAYYVAASASFAGAAALGLTNVIRTVPAIIGTDIGAWTASGIVAAVGLLAFLTGYRSASFGQSDRALRRAVLRTRGERESRTKQMRKRINAIVDSGQAEVDELLRHSRAQVTTYSRLVDDAKRIPDRLSEYDIALEDACNILLDRYRAENADVRRTELPMSFTEHVCFRTEVGKVASMFDGQEDHLRALREGIGGLESAAAAVRQQLRDMNRRAIGNVTPGARPVAPMTDTTVESESILPSSASAATSSVRSIGEHAPRRHGTI